MSLLNKEDFCKGSVKGTIEDVENEISISFEVFIPKQEYSHSDNDFEIYLDDVYDKDYNDEWSENLEKAMYDSFFLETICDYAFASRTRENIYTDNSCKIYIESSTLEWDEKASEHDKYFTSMNTYGYDGMYLLQTKEEKLEEIEEISQKVADLFDYNVISYENFASHMVDAIEQNFVSDDDINSMSISDIIQESGVWFEVVLRHTKLNDLKTDIMDALNIKIDTIGEQLLEDTILNNFNTEESIISEYTNNFDIDFEKAVKIVYQVIDNEYCMRCTNDDY